MRHTDINFVKANLSYATVYTSKIDSLRFLLCFRSSLGIYNMHLQHAFTTHFRLCRSQRGSLQVYCMKNYEMHSEYNLIHCEISRAFIIIEISRKSKL